MRCAAGSWTVLLLVVGGCAARPARVSSASAFIPPPTPSTVWAAPFDALRAEQWREVELRGHTAYRIVELEGARCLEAHSLHAASILLSPVQFNPQTYPWLSWRWRVDRLVQGEALQRKGGSDAAARVYVYFEHGRLPWEKRNLDYIWSASQPVGTIMKSAFSSESRIIVAEQGPAALGRWRVVERNLDEDYRRAFGEAPPDVRAIGVMSDTDNTQSEALAYFDDLRVSRAPGTASRPSAEPSSQP